MAARRLGRLVGGAGRASPCRSAGGRAGRRPAARQRRAQLPAAGSTRIARHRARRTSARIAISAARVPVTTTGATCGTSSSKSTSQIHDTSRPSAIRSFSATSASARGLGGQRPHRLVGARRVLRAAAQRRTAARSIRSNAAERRARTGRGRSATVAAGIRRGHGRSRPRPARCRRCRGRERQPHGGRPGRAVPREPLASSPSCCTARATTRGRRPGVAAVRAALVAEVAEEDRVVAQAAPQRTHHFESAACGIERGSHRRVVDAEADASRPRRRARRPAGRRRRHERVPAARPATSAAPAIGRPARARRSGRAGRGTGCRAPARGAGAPRRPPAARPRRPRTGPTWPAPGGRAAPRRCPNRGWRRRALRQRSCAAAASTDAAIFAVVVLPLVAETTVERRRAAPPAGRSRRRDSQQQLPGQRRAAAGAGAAGRGGRRPGDGDLGPEDARRRARAGALVDLGQPRLQPAPRFGLRVRVALGRAGSSRGSSATPVAQAVGRLHHLAETARRCAHVSAWSSQARSRSVGCHPLRPTRLTGRENAPVHCSIGQFAMLDHFNGRYECRTGSGNMGDGGMIEKAAI